MSVRRSEPVHLRRRQEGHRGESAFSGTLAAEVFSQVYRVICGKALTLCELGEMVRFTCGGDRRGHRGESAFSGTFAAEALPQVYRVICSKALVLCELDEKARFTCGGGRRKGSPAEGRDEQTGLRGASGAYRGAVRFTCETLTAVYKRKGPESMTFRTFSVAPTGLEPVFKV